LCKEHGLPEPTDVLLFTQYLHALGEVIHFYPRRDTGVHFSELRNYIIIDPEWATRAIYLLLGMQEIAENGGFFDPNILDVAWGDYSTSEQRLLKALLTEEALEVCFEAPHEKGKYVAASLLSPDRREFPFQPVNGHGLRFRFKYPKGIPVGLVTRLIVRQSELLEQNHYYRSGAIFRNKDGVRARVDAALNDPNILEIWVDRVGMEGRFFLKTLREEVLKIHDKSFRNVSFDELVPCVCSECRETNMPEHYTLKSLRKREDKNPRSTVSCNESLEDVPVKAVLEGVYPAEDLQLHTRRFGMMGFGRKLSKSIASEVRTLINDDRLDEALVLMKQECSDTNAVSVMSREYSDLRKQEGAGVEKPEEINRRKNDLSLRLLKLLK